MNLPLRIARRYLFTKRTTNAINIITGIAVFGIAVGTAALLLVLSVFNGFEDLITQMYSNFDPDVKVAPLKGKTFTEDSLTIEKLKRLPGVVSVARTLEEVAFFKYKDNTDVGIIKGVDEEYVQVANVDSVMREGTFALSSDETSYGVMGLGIRNKLSVDIEDPFYRIGVYMAKRKPNPLNPNPFRVQYLQPVGTFSAQPEFDQEYLLTELGFVRALLQLDDQLSALEIKLYPGFNNSSTYNAIQEIVGSDFSVKNRYQQQESFFKLMKVEKWLSYAIAGLMMVMIAFTLIGALWMAVLEKKSDVVILKSLGATDILVRNIFLIQGLLLSVLGLIIGFALAIGIYTLQKTVGIITIPGNTSIDSYPVSMRFIDFIIVILTVLAIGLIASIPPALRAKRISALVREE
ncbi:MAG: FtsX-like permease family protein [Saprospiraceae bacterium]|nr:ABC transporter permease [Lewinella sp.]